MSLRLFQEPARYKYKTLSFCLLFEIKYKDFQEIFEGDDEELMEHIEACREKVRTEPHRHNFNTTASGVFSDDKKSEASSSTRAPEEPKQHDRSVDIPSWIWYKSKSEDKLKAMRYKEYLDYFDRFGGGRFWRYGILNSVNFDALTRLLTYFTPA